MSLFQLVREMTLCGSYSSVFGAPFGFNAWRNDPPRRRICWHSASRQAPSLDTSVSAHIRSLCYSPTPLPRPPLRAPLHRQLVPSFPPPLPLPPPACPSAATWRPQSWAPRSTGSPTRTASTSPTRTRSCSQSRATPGSRGTRFLSRPSSVLVLRRTNLMGRDYCTSNLDS